MKGMKYEKAKSVFGFAFFMSHINAADGMKDIEMGTQILSEQRYEFVDFTETNDKLIAEGAWTGTMKTNIRSLKKDNN